MSFVEMRDKLIEHFNEMVTDVDHLFEVGLDKDQLWDLYLNSFPAGTNDIYRERREHDCSCCRQFIKNIGNVVAIKNNEVITIWDFDTASATYQPVVDALAAFVRSNSVTDVYISETKKIGCLQNYEQLENGQVKAWNHFYLELPDRFLLPRNASVGEYKGRKRDVANVFKRSLDEISEESIETILELISSNTLYKGEEWKSPLTNFLEYKKEYDKLPEDAELRRNYAWVKSAEAGPVIGKIRNHSIGTLLVNLSEGMDLDTAVRKYEQIVAPSNYKRPKEIYTKKMLEDAKKTITELGYLDSLGRRFATLEDITVNNILFSNRDAAKRVSGGMDIFDEMERSVVVNPKVFSKVEEISVDRFVTDVLPTVKELEVYLENRHASNMVSLIAPQNKDAKTMFKWNNNFSWAYSGNMTDSMKELVKAAGGKVDGDLRFSIQWNDSGTDNSDLDAHCVEPTKEHIYFGHKRSFTTKGWLDVDIQYPGGNVAVENICWPSRRDMKPGRYLLAVNQYQARGTNNGFKAEIEFDGQIYSFEYNKPIRTTEYVNVAEVWLNEKGEFSIKELLPSNVSSKDIWGVKSNQFVPVSVVMFSPNYWDEQDGIGHRHYFFMLKDCVNPEEPNGMFNEYLKESLMIHKRVFAALGSKSHVTTTNEQLSGIGFSATKRDELVVKVKGATERVMRVKF